MTIFHQLSIDIKEKYQNGCHLKTLSQNDKILMGACVYIHTKYEVSVDA